MDFKATITIFSKQNSRAKSKNKIQKPLPAKHESFSGAFLARGFAERGFAGAAFWGVIFGAGLQKAEGLKGKILLQDEDLPRKISSKISQGFFAHGAIFIVHFGSSTSTQ